MHDALTFEVRTIVGIVHGVIAALLLVATALGVIAADSHERADWEALLCVVLVLILEAATAAYFFGWWT